MWGQEHPQLFLIQCFLLVCRKKTQELSNCCPLHRYVSPAPSPVAPRGSFLPPGQSQEGLLHFQTERSSGSGEETVSAQGGWRSGTAAPGAPCAMTPGAWQRLRWCVSSWADGQALEVMRSAAFGLGNGSIWLDEVQCRGQESSLWDCAVEPWGQSGCKHEEDAGVRCSGE